MQAHRASAQPNCIAGDSNRWMEMRWSRRDEVLVAERGESCGGLAGFPGTTTTSKLGSGGSRRLAKAFHSLRLTGGYSERRKSLVRRRWSGWTVLRLVGSSQQARAEQSGCDFWWERRLARVTWMEAAGRRPVTAEVRTQMAQCLLEENRNTRQLEGMVSRHSRGMWDIGVIRTLPAITAMADRRYNILKFRRGIQTE